MTVAADLLHEGALQAGAEVALAAWIMRGDQRVLGPEVVGREAAVLVLGLEVVGRVGPVGQLLGEDGVALAS